LVSGSLEAAQMTSRAPRTRTATIRDVAEMADVSVATVSRMFNASGPVSDDARRRIHRAARRLRYAPNEAARSLITRRSSVLGVLLPDLYGEFFSEVIRGIDSGARRHGYHVLVSGAHNDRSQIEAALRAMRGRVDGLIVMSPDIDAATLKANLASGVPVVLLNCDPAGRGIDALNIDNAAGAYAMTRHLLSLGHERIAFIRGAEGNVDAAERLEGYRAALREAGAEHHDAWEPCGGFTESGGHAAALTLLRCRPRPRAVFAANDAMAIGALSAFHDAGVVVPDEIAVAGFDDIPTARFTSPPLSSVHVPIAALGERAIERVIHAITKKNRHKRHRELVPVTLVVRRSCGAPTQ
jgi:LacI family transcriptional regulator